MKARIEHLNSSYCPIDARMVEATSEQSLEIKIKAALFAMIKANVVEVGDRFVVAEAD